MIRTLEELVAPLSAATFLSSFAAKSRLLIRADSAERTNSLFPWSDIDRLLANDAVPPNLFRVRFNNNDVARSLYRNPDGTIRKDVIQSMASQGASFVVNGMAMHVPQIAELAAAIERKLNHRVFVNCYVTFGESPTFRPHFDSQDVIVVQVHGSKRWLCYGIDVPYPIHGAATSAFDVPSWESELRPGDVLYLPRGEVHEAVPVDRPAVHLTFSTIGLRGFEYIEWLAEQAKSDPLFRMDLTRELDPHEQENRLKQSLLGLIDRSSFEQFFLDDDRKRELLTLATFESVERLRPESQLVAALRRQIDLRIADESGLELEIGGKRMHLKALSRRALHIIAARQRLTYAALAAELDLQADNPALIESLEELGRHALIGIVD